jgi:hypothetical protein
MISAPNTISQGVFVGQAWQHQEPGRDMRLRLLCLRRYLSPFLSGSGQE